MVTMISGNVAEVAFGEVMMILIDASRKRLNARAGVFVWSVLLMKVVASID